MSSISYDWEYDDVSAAPVAPVGYGPAVTCLDISPIPGGGRAPYFCTLSYGHAGEHIAHFQNDPDTPDRVALAWYDTPVTLDA